MQFPQASVRRPSRNPRSWAGWGMCAPYCNPSMYNTCGPYVHNNSPRRRAFEEKQVQAAAQGHGKRPHPRRSLCCILEGQLAPVMWI